MPIGNHLVYFLPFFNHLFRNCFLPVDDHFTVSFNPKRRVKVEDRKKDSKKIEREIEKGREREREQERRRRMEEREREKMSRGIIDVSG